MSDSSESTLIDDGAEARGRDPLLAVDQLLPGDDEVAVATALPKQRSRFRRYVRRGLVVIVVLLIPVTYSYVTALTGPGNDSLQARTVEWARDHHLGGLVDRVEKYWYARHQAKVGGVPSESANQLGLRPAGGAAPAPSTTVPVVVAPTTTAELTESTDSTPAVIAPPSTEVTTTTAPPPLLVNPPAALVTPAPEPVAQEGEWSGMGAPLADGRFGAYATLIRPDDVHTSILDAVVWFDPAHVSLRQYPGTKIPGAPWDRPDFIEPERQPALMAAFAGGFRLSDSRGGMFLGGAELKPLRDGGATLVIDSNGVPNIGEWSRDFTSTAGLDSVRQNLDLIVDGGVVAPRLATDANRAWGFTGPDNHDAVWRSGAGVTADGALVWVGGPGLSITSLAETLVRAGAIRGMQLDINHEWVQFNTYAPDADGIAHGTRLIRAMQHSDDRYLSEDTRDFVAVFSRPA
jgi:hypothetical protein